MGKLITTEDGYEIRLGQKNPSCYPCCFEGSVCACRSDLCIKHRDNYIREHGKLPQGEGIYPGRIWKRVKPESFTSNKSLKSYESE